MKRLLRKIGGDAASPPRPSGGQILNGLLGGGVGIALLALLTTAQGWPLLMAPLGASCVLLFAAPDTPLAQPRNVIGGHLVASLVGLLLLRSLGPGALSMGLAVGLAIALMQATRTLHAPAGADPLVLMLAGKVSWGFLLAPVLAGSVLLVLLALLVNNLPRGRSWPRYWL